jgi:hypothetical protein
LADRVTDLFLVAVAGGGVDEPEAGRQRLADHGAGLLGRHLPHAEAEAWHAPAVVQGEKIALHDNPQWL